MCVLLFFRNFNFYPINYFSVFYHNHYINYDFYNLNLYSQTLTAAFRQFDTDQDGYITIHYEQFLNMVFGLKI